MKKKAPGFDLRDEPGRFELSTAAGPADLLALERRDPDWSLDQLRRSPVVFGQRPRPAAWVEGDDLVVWIREYCVVRAPFRSVASAVPRKGVRTVPCRFQTVPDLVLRRAERVRSNHGVDSPDPWR